MECLAVLGSALPHNIHMPPPDNGQGQASEADSPSGDWPSHRGLFQTTVEIWLRLGWEEYGHSLPAGPHFTKGRTEGGRHARCQVYATGMQLR